MVQFGVVILLLNYALQLISAGRAALLFATLPLLTLLFAAALGHERMTWPKTLGILLTIIGVGLTISDKTGLAAGGGLGDAF